MIRVKTFDSTGVAPNGKLFASDLNAIQDAAAAITDLTQHLSVADLAIGESGLLLSRYGAGQAQLAGLLRIASGVLPGVFTTTQRDAIAAGKRPQGLVIFNTTTVQLEINVGSDASPNWQPAAPALTTGSVTAAMLAANSVDTSKIVDGTITTADIANAQITAALIAGALKPSVSAADATEALRALGTGAGLAAPGWSAMDWFTRVSGGSVPNSGLSTVTTLALTGSAAGDYVIAWGAALGNGAQGGTTTAQLARSGAGGAVIDTQGGGGFGAMVFSKKLKVTLTAGETLTLSGGNAGGFGGAVNDAWIDVVRVA